MRWRRSSGRICRVGTYSAIVDRTNTVTESDERNNTASRANTCPEMTTCSHLDQVTVVAPPDRIAGCEECLKLGSPWRHLRMCQTCGAIGCCDSSPNKHASRHAHEQGHPIARSVEPGEDWSWCYVDEVMFRLAPD